ncbi:MAG TPA: hypothetical protein VGJ20_19220 [Xanthobacteraceae bacterium]
MITFPNALDTLVEALLAQEFRPAGHFDTWVTYKRENDAFKIHVGPDAAFAVFNVDDELVTEGQGAKDLYAVLVERTPASSSRRS